MKRIALTLLAVGLLSGSLLQAQTTEVTAGSTRTFTVNLLNGVTLNSTNPYTWSHSGAGIVSATPSNNTLNVTFSNVNGSTGHIEVYATSADNCKSDIKQMNLTVVPTLTYHATFAQASQDVCPQTTGNPAGGKPTSVVINFTGGNVNSFVYTLDGVSTTVTLTAPGVSYTLDLSSVTYTNAQAGAHTLEIVSITGGTITSMLPNGSTVHTINVDTAPVISDIF
jgi:Tfp pilus assembly protein PilV